VWRAQVQCDCQTFPVKFRRIISNFTISAHSLALLAFGFRKALLPFCLRVEFMQSPRHTPQLPGLDQIATVTRGKPDGAEDPAGEAGWYLMREREARGLTIMQAGEQTGIHPYHVEAIEFGDMRHMPARAEALEMIAAYANFLGFEPEPLLQHYISFLPAPQVAPRNHPANPAPMSSAKILSFGKFIKLPPLPAHIRLPTMPTGNNGIIASVAGAFMVFASATWMLVPSGHSVPTEQIAAIEPADPMPTATTKPDAADVKISETQMDDDPAAAVAVGQVEGEASPIELDNDAMAAFIQKNVAGTKAADTDVASIDAAPSNGHVFGAKGDDVHVVLKANRAIWLIIEDAQGKRLATQALNKGDTYRVPNRPGLRATVQDGGAITYMIDGVEKGVLGQPGNVLAAEPLDVNKLSAKEQG
jgi:cytoskeleton protein RodZ